MSCRAKKCCKYALVFMFFILIAALLVGYSLLKGSLPQLSGTYPVSNLNHQVRIERDGRGIPSIHAGSRLDVAQALGFLHAQDRFFQMDLMRRASAGELSELFGARTLDFDKSRRFHQFRKRSQVMMENLPAVDRELLQAYTEGVNAGIKSLKVRPFEYLLLFSEPQPWLPEDTFLVCFGLFLQLQDPKGEISMARGYMKNMLPEDVYDFFVHNGSAWQASLDASYKPSLPIPPEDSFAYLLPSPQESIPSVDDIKKASEFHVGGSNQWAVQGSRSHDGNAMLACDMHLKLSLPGIWYRAGFIYPNASGDLVSVYGATLPGSPFMIIGSNQNIAWGYTNACINTTHLVLLDQDAQSNEGYKTPTGPQKLETEVEVIKIKGQDPFSYPIKKSLWGPVLNEEFFGHRVAVSWIAHDPACMNMNLIKFETVKNVDQALQVAKEVRVPVLNFMVADKEGHIGWTLIGGILERSGFEGNTPESLSDGTKKIQGYKDSNAYPSITDPSQEYLWTANNRQLGDEWVHVMGRTGFVNGMRAYQIHKNLSQANAFDAQKMLELQMNNEATFFDRWHSLMLDLLEQAQTTASRQELKAIIEKWDHCCNSDSAAFYWIRNFRKIALHNIVSRLLAPCISAYPSFPLAYFDFEEPVWMIVSEKPAYLAASSFNNWHEELMSYIDEMIKDTPSSKLKEETWGKNAYLKMQHPMHESLPIFQEWLRMPHSHISGDYYVLRFHTSSEGASQRMVVSPGKEEQGIFQMPGGQSGHPLSPHFCDCHVDWLKGHPTPFLPGKTEHTLVLTPTVK